MTNAYTLFSLIALHTAAAAIRALPAGGRYIEDAPEWGPLLMPTCDLIEKPTLRYPTISFRVMVECNARAAFVGGVYYTFHVEARFNNTGDWLNYRDWSNNFKKTEGTYQVADDEMIEDVLDLTRREANIYAKSLATDAEAKAEREEFGITEGHLLSDTVSDKSREAFDEEWNGDYDRARRLICEGFADYDADQMERVIQRGLERNGRNRATLEQIDLFLNAVVCAAAEGAAYFDAAEA